MQQPQLSLLVGGFVKKVYTISQKRIFLRGPSGSEIVDSVTIDPEDEYRFRVLEAKLQTGRHVSLSWHAYQENNKTAYRFLVKNLKREKGRYNDSIVLRTDSPILPEIRIDIFGNIRPQE